MYLKIFDGSKPLAIHSTESRSGSPTPRDKIKGALYGLLVGDALGVPYEFHDPAEIPPYEEIEYEPPKDFNRAHQGVPPGTWSDDGAQALCLLVSLLERGEFHLIDFAQRLEAWYFDGYLAVDGRVFDIGIQTREAIVKLRKNFFPDQAGRRDEHANGNGSLMRALPLALWSQDEDEKLVEDAHEQSIVTHGHPRSMVCCAAYCLWARRIWQESSDPWNKAIKSLRKIYQTNPQFLFELEEHVAYSDSRQCRGTGYVVDCLHSAKLACQENSFEAVVKQAIALGNDTDTTACVAGGVAGLKFGYSQIPKRWIAGLRGRKIVDPLFEKLESSRVRDT